MEIASRFDFSDLESSEPFKPYFLNYIKNLDDEDVLEQLNAIPRSIGIEFEKLNIVEQEVQNRELLIEHPITLQERSDDWLAARRGDIRKELSILSKQEDELKEERELIDVEFKRRFDERGTSGTRTSLYTITMKEEDNYPEVYDRTEFENYILETQKIHLLQKRLSMGAIQEELAVLKEDYLSYLTRLEESSCPKEEAVLIYKELFGDVVHAEQLENKINILKKTDTLVDTLKQELQDYANIPGIKLVKKLTINAKKRG